MVRRRLKWLGYPNFVIHSWYVLLAPAKTPREIVNRLNKIVTDTLATAETREQLGGYFLIDVPNLDEAIAIAGRIAARPPSERHKAADTTTYREGGAA